MTKKSLVFRSLSLCWAALMMLLSFASIADNLSPLLKNRFRLDHGIEEITLVIYRHDGSAPVVLIQPDGSKLYASRHPEESVAWFDDAAFDLITIKKPMAGPWQVVGSVDPRNRMVTMSDVSLVMDALPEELYVGERLRLTARVVNRGQTIALAPFVADLKMEIWARAVGLSSSYDLSYNGLKLGEFIDDGTGFDESPGDGVLTGTLDLNISADQYEMSLRVYNPTFERVANHSLRLLPSPVTADLVVVEEKPVAIYFQFDGSAVELDNIALSGTIFASDGREREFTLSTQGQDNTQFSLAELTESGDYRMEAEVFGRSVTTGRDMALATNVVRFSVVNLPPTPQERVAEVVGGEAPERVPEAGLGRLMDQIDEEFNRQLFELNQKVNKPQPSVNWWLIAGINLGLLLLAAIMMFVYKWMMLQKTKAAALEAEKSKGPEVEELDEELIDLSLPED